MHKLQSPCAGHVNVSLQVFRALRPILSSEACTALMAGLAKCLANPSKLSLEVAADVILTLQVILCSTLAASVVQCL